LWSRWVTSSEWRFSPRAATELTNGDWTLAIVLGAMGVECDLVYLFMKWKRIDHVSTGTPINADEEEWEQQWRDDARTVAARLDKVSSLLTGKPFDSFLSHNVELLRTVQTWYPKNAASPKDFFIKGLFHKRQGNAFTHGRGVVQQERQGCVLRLRQIRHPPGRSTNRPK
jgi:hypothetical protein